MTSARFTPEDRRFMEQALALAALAEGTTRPNPRVGCVLARDGVVVGWGHHRAPGEPHAEAIAVDRARERARGATAYVNLEPCAHQGRTPPCADALIRGAVGRVVAGIQDPDPRVDGRGLERLRLAGIRVDTGLLAEQGEELNAGFLRWHRGRTPRVTIKAASTLDGLLSASGGASRWITGEPARRFAHRLRLRHDAILVGAGTVRRDDPTLDVRLPGAESAPLRVVLSGRGPLPDDARVLGGARAARVYRPAEGEDRVDPRRVLADLGALGIQSLLVEGGGRTIASFLEAGLVDDAAVFVAPSILGGRGGTPLADGPTADRPDGGWRIAVRHRIRLAEDLVLLGPVVPGRD